MKIVHQCVEPCFLIHICVQLFPDKLPVLLAFVERIIVRLRGIRTEGVDEEEGEKRREYLFSLLADKLCPSLGFSLPPHGKELLLIPFLEKIL